eukprot:1159404-Pelagomonas_calceolata.AAC.13
MFAVSKRAVGACSKFLFTILGMTAAVSVRPGPPVRSFEHEGLWIVAAKVGACNGSKFITEMWIGSDEFGI